MGIEKRNYPRSDMRIAVSYESVEEFLTDYTANVSIGGFFLVTEVELQKSHQFHLRMHLPDGSEIKAIGIVQWISDGSDGPKGVGIHFSVISDRDVRKIQRLMDSWDES